MARFINISLHLRYMNLPVRIENCPIVDATFEVRFNSNIYPSAVFGVIYNQLKDKYPKIEKLPILQLPEELRETDPTLMFKPTYKAVGEYFTIQIGPNVFSISSNMPYVGWEKYLEEIRFNVNILLELKIIKSLKRIGLRYVNYFDVDIFKNINMEVQINSKVSNLSKTVFRTELKNKNFLITLQIANNATKVTEGKESLGSIIDIDTFKDFNGGFDYSIPDFIQLVEAAHKKEKKLFFSLFTSEFLKSLNPVYS